MPKTIIIAGPCVIENYDMLMKSAEYLKKLCQDFDFDFIFKASFDKANRTSIKSFRGPGLDEGLKLLAQVKQQLNVKICTDIHENSQANPTSEVADILQIPAFLCRQTDLLLAAASTGKIVNVKKGQFLSANELQNVIAKLKSKDLEQNKIMLTERGNSFGYQNLVVDFRNILIMKSFGVKVLFDATHAVQRPAAMGDKSGGDSQFVPYLAKCGIVCGADGLFLETHQNPSEALSDGANMLDFDQIQVLLRQIKALEELNL